jgi:hypothetical protein
VSVRSNNRVSVFFISIIWILLSINQPRRLCCWRGNPDFEFLFSLPSSTSCAFCLYRQIILEREKEGIHRVWGRLGRRWCLLIIYMFGS